MKIKQIDKTRDSIQKILENLITNYILAYKVSGTKKLKASRLKTNGIRVCGRLQ